MPRIDIRGLLIPNDYKWYFDFYGEESTCPRDVQKILDAMVDGDDLDVYISSPGGVIEVGSEIYTLLRKAGEKASLKIHITGQAHSAASVIAMAGYCEMAPTALMMVHCVSTSCVSGNHTDMEHMAEILREADRALCTAYMTKSGMSEEAALEMMEHETWLRASEARERGLIDAVMFEEQEPQTMVAAESQFRLPTKAQMALVWKMAGMGENKDPGRTILEKRSRARLNVLRNPIFNKKH